MPFFMSMIKVTSVLNLPLSAAFFIIYRITLIFKSNVLKN